MLTKAQAWQIEQIQAGFDELRNGRSISHDAVSSWLASWGEDDEGSPPEK